MSETKLPIEKELTLEAFNRQVDQMSHEQAKAVLKELMRQHLISAQLYQELLKRYMLPS